MTLASHRRSEPRMTFPTGRGPFLEAGGQRFEILDISNTGVRFLAPSTDITIGDLLRGTICLAPDRMIAIEGRVLRAGPDQVAARVEEGTVVPGSEKRRRPAGGLLW